jgi:hypothetical protein
VTFAASASRRFFRFALRVREALDELEGVELISNHEQHVIIEEAHEAKGGSVVNKR